jgi:hypothetical protein
MTAAKSGTVWVILTDTIRRNEKQIPLEARTDPRLSKQRTSRPIA